MKGTGKVAKSRNKKMRKKVRSAAGSAEPKTKCCKEQSKPVERREGLGLNLSS